MFNLLNPYDGATVGIGFSHSLSIIHWVKLREGVTNVHKEGDKLKVFNGYDGAIVGIRLSHSFSTMHWVKLRERVTNLNIINVVSNIPFHIMTIRWMSPFKR